MHWLLIALALGQGVLNAESHNRSKLSPTLRPKAEPDELAVPFGLDIRNIDNVCRTHRVLYDLKEIYEKAGTLYSILGISGIETKQDIDTLKSNCLSIAVLEDRADYIYKSLARQDDTYKKQIPYDHWTLTYISPKLEDATRGLTEKVNLALTCDQFLRGVTPPKEAYEKITKMLKTLRERARTRFNELAGDEDYLKTLFPAPVPPKK